MIGPHFSWLILRQAKSFFKDHQLLSNLNVIFLVSEFCMEAAGPIPMVRKTPAHARVCATDIYVFR